MSTKERLDEFRARLEALSASDEQKGQNRSVRQNAEALFDAGTFVEIGAFSGGTGYSLKDQSADSSQGVLTGYGAVDGRLTFFYAQDFDVLSGALSCANAKKILDIMDLAAKAGAPIISLLRSNGAKLEEGMQVLGEYGKVFAKANSLSGVVPQI